MESNPTIRVGWSRPKFAPTFPDYIRRYKIPVGAHFECDPMAQPNPVITNVRPQQIALANYVIAYKPMALME